MTDHPKQDPPSTEGTVPQPRLAASVILLRDAPDGLEAFVQHRVDTMDFAAGMVVFPGGRVDSADGSGWDYPAELLERHSADWNQSSIGADPGEAQGAGLAGIAARWTNRAGDLGLSAFARTSKPLRSTTAATKEVPAKRTQRASVLLWVPKTFCFGCRKHIDRSGRRLPTFLRGQR